jgi:lipoprotein-anchoring transpeptidase ErfK/SrfK
MRGAVAFGVLAGFLTAGVAATEARAQGYGGGFIELLMTGHDPTPSLRAARPNPLYGTAQPSYGRTQTAALPGTGLGEEAGIGRIIDPKYRRQTVDYAGPHAPGTIVVDTPAKFLYLVQPGGKALRYGIGVGRPGFAWAGVKTVSMKREWPDWTPPAEMLRRRPDLPRHMAGGPANPLGARALYLGSSLYRIHGTNEPYTIGQSVSSGCIRMMNEDVTDLYDRVGVGTKVIVI